MTVRACAALLVLAVATLACRSGAGGPQPVDPNADRAALEQRARAATDAVTDAHLVAAASDPADWITHGGSDSEMRFSGLAKIDATNVGQLGLAWYYDTNTNRGLEATPIVVDGILYATASWSTVLAIDAKTASEIWHDDPQIPRAKGADACCDVVNRGVAVYEGRVDAGTIDGRLVALDAATGALAWRFYTAPGDPSRPQGPAAREKVLPTSAKSGPKGGPDWWIVGGGGTVWDSMAYDSELDLLYVGTGNGAPWSRYARSPGGGDDLHLSSILALRPETGELLSAEKYVEVTWATGIDKKTGRPIEAKGTDYREQAVVVKPSPYGGHNRQPMSFNPSTGLVYIPAQEIPIAFLLDKRFRYKPGRWNTGTDFRIVTEAPREMVKGHLLAWDPVAQKEVWRVDHRTAWNGGTLTTAGNLVFQGTADGRFVAYRADTGAKLWEAPAQTGVIARPSATRSMASRTSRR